MASSPASSKPFWDFNTTEINNWVRQLAPAVPNTGGMLFPKRDAAAANTPEFKSKVAAGNTLLQNLTRALNCASSRGGGGAPKAKKQKVDNGAGKGKGDVYQILDPSFAKSNGVASSELSTGAILSRMTLGGLVNGLAGFEGGVVDTLTCIPLAAESTVIGNVNEATKKEATRKEMENMIATAGNSKLGEVVRLARGLHRSVAARTEMDILSTTPRRIADLLCPEITTSELKSIRRRIHDTVVLGLGTHSSAHAASLEDEAKEVPVAARTAKHEIEQWKRCDSCGNNTQSEFVLDRKNGDLICTNCGAIVSESIMHEGSQYRKFEGEEDRNHHGDAPNPLFSNSHNMATTLGGMSFQTGAGMGGYGSGAKGGIENILRNAHAYTEMNISQFGKEEKKTRIGYKDRQKKDAFYQMVHAGDALGLHEAVVQRAKELFAGFRDDRELVQQFKGVIAACLSEAFDQLSRDGRQLLKKKAGEADGGGDADSAKDDGPKVVHARASRRNDLHSASLAGKGGLLLDTTVVSHGGVGGGALDQKLAKGSITGQPWEAKPSATWDLDDCKGWMFEATKSIARSWVEAQQWSGVAAAESKNGGTNDNNPAMAIPKGTKDELEGQLVEHSLKICEYLETELKKSPGAGGGRSRPPAAGARRVTTPRVADMGVLGIKWQRPHERGSGGKGGVGNSGRTITGTKPGERRRRTAGQVLLLLTARKFGNIVEDPAAGTAFHRELKAVTNREGAQKRMERMEESGKARLKQMNRKPWLQQRVNQHS